MKRVIAAAVVVAVCLVATPADALDVRSGVGNGGASADVTARNGSSGGSPVGGRNSGSGSACSSRVIDFTGEGDLVLVPCDYHDGMMGPFAPVQPAAGAPTAQQISSAARELARSLPVPSPEPRLSASTGIAGARHSLDLRTADRKYFPAEATQFGALSAVAYGTFSVDWGDGTRETFDVTGGPWPNTDISHAWSDTGNYTIEVRANWSVDWQLGGYSGVVTGLQTSGTIPNVPIVEAQAVLIR